jgi:hypothetical protein
MCFADMPKASISSAGLPECGMFLTASSRDLEGEAAACRRRRHHGKNAESLGLFFNRIDGRCRWLGWISRTQKTLPQRFNTESCLFQSGYTRHASNRDILSDEVAYLKSVLLWLQEYWTGPAVRTYPLRAVPQVSRHYSARSTYSALNRRDVIIDLPAFLPLRNISTR